MAPLNPQSLENSPGAESLMYNGDHLASAGWMSPWGAGVALKKAGNGSNRRRAVA